MTITQLHLVANDMLTSQINELRATKTQVMGFYIFQTSEQSTRYILTILIFYNLQFSGYYLRSIHQLTTYQKRINILEITLSKNAHTQTSM